MKTAATVVSSILLLGALGGCATALQLNDANEQLASHYAALEQAKDDPMMREAEAAALRELGQVTANRAAEESDPANRISFYRVAATAAWKGRDASVVQYVTDGSTACQDAWDDSPRDCGMLAMIGDLAAIDETTATFNTLDAESQPEMVASVVRQYDAIAKRMIESREPMVGRVPADLLAAYDDRLDDLVCKHMQGGALGLAVTVSAPVDTNCLVGNLRLQALAAEVELPSCRGQLPDEPDDSCG